MEQSKDTRSAIFDKEAREDLASGYGKLHDAVASTLGPKGRNVVIYRGVYNTPLTTKDGVTVARAFTAEGRFEKIGAQMAKDIASRSNDLAGDGPSDKATPVATPTGWTPIGDLSVGDIICGTDESVQKVEGIYDKGSKEVCIVKFDDGRSLRCCRDHLWEVRSETGEKRVIPVQQMINEGVSYNEGNKTHSRFYTPVTGVFYEEQHLPLDPYIVGLALGNHLLETPNGLEYLTKKDTAYTIIDLPQGIYDTASSEGDNLLRVNFRGVDSAGNTLKDNVNALGLLNNIPDIYLYNSKQNRLRLLQGLINTKDEFTSMIKSDSLATDFIQLCRSLGISVKSYKDQNSMNHIMAKADHRYGLKIVEIEETGENVEMVCIKVSNPDHLYVTNDFVVTHNTTTSTILGYSMLTNGLQAIDEGAQPVWLKEGMDLAVKACITHLDELSQSIRTAEAVESIATISANNDESSGEIIAEAITKVGDNGTVTIEKSPKDGIYVDYSSGYSWKNGFITDVHHPSGNANKGTVYDNCEVLIIDEAISIASTSINNYLEAFSNADNRSPLIFIVRDASGIFLKNISDWVGRFQLPIGIIQAPGYGDNQKQTMQDIATLCECKVIKDISDPITDEHIGNVTTISVKKDITTLYGVSGSKQSIADRVKGLQEELAECNIDIDAEELRVRIAKLSSSIATIFVGAKSEFELDEKIHRLEDALAATRAAIEEGIVAGGGIALIACLNTLEGLSLTLDKDTALGVNIVKKAIMAPFTRILENGGYNLDDVLNQIEQSGGNYPTGFNARSGEIVNMITAGIIDPVKVTKTALESANTIASMLLLTSCVIIPS